MRSRYYIMIAIMFALTNIALHSESKNHDKLLRKADSVFDLQQNTVSNFQFYTTNYGIFGLDTANHGTGGGYWPRGSQNQYLFAQGIWFGCVRRDIVNSQDRTLVVVSYDPNNGNGWFGPGRFDDGDLNNSNRSKLYRTYFSTDFNKISGLPVDLSDGPAWPLWKDKNTPKFHFGTYNYNYVKESSKRNYIDNPRGPLFVSDEDIFSTFNDSDLSRYHGSNFSSDDSTQFRLVGYPIGLQVESNIYSFNTNELKDVVVIAYNIENVSADTLKKCWLAGVFDIDIALYPYTSIGAKNDYSRFYNEDPSKNLAIAWTCDTLRNKFDKVTGKYVDTNAQERGHGFGYIGVSLLETPALDNNGFIRNDKPYFKLDEQIGLKTFRDWPIEEDKNTSNDRYQYMSGGVIDSYNPQMGDKRIMIATGQFNMLPGTKAHIAFAITFAMPAKGGEADGTTEDLTGIKVIGKKTVEDSTNYGNSLIGKLNYLQDYYYNKLQDTHTDTMVVETLDVVYPNPADSYLTLPDKYITQNDVVFIYSMEGKLELELTYIETINISPLAPGAYFLRAGDKTYKFVKK